MEIRKTLDLIGSVPVTDKEHNGPFMMAVRTGCDSSLGIELSALSTKVNGALGCLGRGAVNEAQRSTPGGSKEVKKWPQNSLLEDTVNSISARSTKPSHMNRLQARHS